jgi:NDP-sugar pyrophosphorylase family protein
MLAVVLSAGRGKRLHPLTKDRSKAMMPIAGKPMIERVLDMLTAGGATGFIVVAHPDMLDLLKWLSRSSWGQEIELVYQQERLGMAHALECAAPQVLAADVSEFLLASCDSLYPGEHVGRLIARHRGDALDATLTLMWIPPEQATASAVVILEDGAVADITEKPSLEEIPSYNRHQEALSAPSLYALTPSVLDYLPGVSPSWRGEREFPDALRLLTKDGGRVGGELVEERMTLTDANDLLAINRQVLHTDPACATIETDLPDDVMIVPPVRIEAGVRVASGCHIGPEVYLETGCSLGAGTVVRRAIVLRDAALEGGRTVEELVIR